MSSGAWFYRSPDGGLVSTAEIGDGGKQPFETLIASPLYHNDLVDLTDATLVEGYDTLEQAAAGHARWVSLYQRGELPDPLIDCLNIPAESRFGCQTNLATCRRGVLGKATKLLTEKGTGHGARDD